MSIDDQIRELELQADAADRREHLRQAAFLYEQARRLAIDDGQTARAFSVGVDTARCWSHAGDYRRELTVLLELLYDVPDTANPWDVYRAKVNHFWHLLEVKASPDLDELMTLSDELASLCASLGEPDHFDTPYRTGMLLKAQGKWEEALTQFEIAWSRGPTGGIYQAVAAAQAASVALRVARRADAQRWLTHIHSDDWSDNAHIRAANARLLIALWDNNKSAAHAALLGIDDAMRGVERNRYSAECTETCVAALLLDEHFGDPLAPSHPAGQRLAEFPRSELDIPVAVYNWHSATIIRQLAGLRYAAGMSPVDDLYYRKPHKLRRQTARLPKNLSRRVVAARQVCDEAMPVAVLLDNSFRCSFRQQENKTLRSRIDEIAAANNL